MQKKIFSFLILFSISIFNLFSVPYFDSFIKDNSGSYVYYRDYSFFRESYIGILTYDESTYQIRYFAPKDEKKNLPEKEIAILLTINPDASHWEMTGEKIITKITASQEDTDLVNYLHDILYEFSSRRSKIDLTPDDERYVWGDDFWENGLNKSQDYFQFGGNVTICFDCLIPIFNIKSITADDGTTALRCCTIGTLKSSDDKSFNNFKGFKDYNPLNKTNIAKAYTSTQTHKHICDKHSIFLDENWSEDVYAPSICTLNNDAVLLMLNFPQIKNQTLQNDFYTISGYLNSIYSKYIDLATCSISYDKKIGKYTVITDSYIPDSSSYMTAHNTILKNDEGGFDILTISAYKGSWIANEDYYFQIINSYK